MPNGLAGALSPYLLAHAEDPVDWQQWGDAAIAKARATDRPILLSVGYAACHWCHVMHSESFLDPEIAAQINRLTVPVKVDREELPDVDQAYQSVCMAVTRQGGWPLTAFLTPDLRPFHIGTYFPPHSRFGQPGLVDVLLAVDTAWRDRRAEVEEVAQDWAALGRDPVMPPSAPPPDGLQAAGDVLIARYDHAHGGFGGAPKFPTPPNLSVLLRQHLRDGAEAPLGMLHGTLAAMARGGIHDQLGGGFHRYSVDAGWRVPHFEKMLYDNALLAPLYLAGWQATGDDRLKDVARTTLDYLVRDLRDPAGGFYSAQDADSPAGEGAYFTWTADEMHQVLGAQAPLAIARFGVGDPQSVVEGRSVLRIAARAEDLAADFGGTSEEIAERLAAASSSLLLARAARQRPATDEKILTGWNGLAITAFARAALALDEPAYLQAAKDAADFLLTRMRPEGGLLRRYYHGEAGIPAYLEDYAYLAEGLVWLYAASLEERYLTEAVGFALRTKDLFWDEASGALRTAPPDAPAPLGPQSDPYDGALPAPQSVAIRTALLLSGIAPALEAEDMAEAAFAAQGEVMRRAPLAVASLAEAQDLARRGATELTLVGPTGDARIAAWHREIGRRLLPDLLLTRIDAARDRPLWQGKETLGGRPTVYACCGARCAPPLTDISAALAWLGENR
ncbi:MAG: thioredoxin domain-containing protein [Thermaerobacter sp.]|nr:thioredoxin domain-containing protein [Thermaerobacter sp.]